MMMMTELYDCDCRVSLLATLHWSQKHYCCKIIYTILGCTYVTFILQVNHVFFISATKSIHSIRVLNTLLLHSSFFTDAVSVRWLPIIMMTTTRATMLTVMVMVAVLLLNLVPLHSDQQKEHCCCWLTYCYSSLLIIMYELSKD